MANQNQKPQAPAETKKMGDYLKNNPKAKWVLVAVCAIVGCFLGYFAYQQFVVKPADEKAQSQLFSGIALINQGVQVKQQFSQQVELQPDSILEQQMRQSGLITETTPQDSVPVIIKKQREDGKKMVNSYFEKALNGDGKYPGFIKLSKGSGSAANIAAYQAGIAYYHMDNYKEAIKYLEEFSPKGDQSVSALAIFALANCYACDKQLDKAVDTFKKAAKHGDNKSISPVCLLEAGKILENQGKKSDAHAIYEQIKEEYPDFGMVQEGSLASEIDKYLERTK